MKIGDLIESAIWITGDESEAMRLRYEGDVVTSLSHYSLEEGFEHGPVTFTEKLPGTAGIPPVPDHIQGSRVRLLVAETKIIGLCVQTSQGSFVANLEKKDLERLRTITRRAWMKQHPQDVLTDAQCDEYLEEIGPEAAVETLRAQFHTLQ